MKKHLLNLLLVCLLLTFTAPQAMNATVSATVPTTENPADAERANQLLRRLDEIKAMDKSELSKTEKKALRKEVQETKKELRALSGGVYLSVGAIIIIILLLILLL